VAAKSYADGYLIRTPAGEDYDERATRDAAIKVAEGLGKGATVHPLKPGRYTEVMTGVGGKEIVTHIVK